MNIEFDIEEIINKTIKDNEKEFEKNLKESLTRLKQLDKRLSHKEDLQSLLTDRAILKEQL